MLLDLRTRDAGTHMLCTGLGQIKILPLSHRQELIRATVQHGHRAKKLLLSKKIHSGVTLGPPRGETTGRSPSKAVNLHPSLMGKQHYCF